MPLSISLTLLGLLCLGVAVLLLQARNKKKGFMTPGQDNLVGLVGFVAFMGLMFVCLKMLFR